MEVVKLAIRLLKNTLHVETIPYPSKKAPPPIFTFELLRYPSRDEEKCIGCGSCAHHCSGKATYLEEDGDRLVIRFVKARCIGCGRCSEICPVEAIEMKQPQLFAYTREELPPEETLTKPLQRCCVCGTPFAPQQLVDEAIAKALEKLEEPLYTSMSKDYAKLRDLCPSCRKKLSLVMGTHPVKYIKEVIKADA